MKDIFRTLENGYVVIDDRPSAYITVKNDRVVLDDHPISTLSELLELTTGKMLLKSSSIDFPDEFTTVEATIKLANDISTQIQWGPKP